MKWGIILIVTIAAVWITLYEWPKMNPKQKKEKRLFIAMTISGWLLNVLITFYPEMPGPTQLIDLLYKPLGKMMEP